MTQHDLIDRDRQPIVFISQPMLGKTDDEIKADRDRAIEIITGIFPYALCPITYVPHTPHKGVTNFGIYYLAKSLDVMSECNMFYMADGWENARGCRLERKIAISYGLHEIRVIKGGKS